MPGRPAKPTALKLIKGTAKKSRIKNEPKPKQTARIPAPPAHLCKKGAAEWRRIVKELHDTGILTRVDLKTFAVYCDSFAMMLTAQGLLNKWNLANPDYQNVFKSPSGNLSTHPYVLQVRQHRQDMLRAATECGITPAARTRVHSAKKDEGNEFDKF